MSNFEKYIGQVFDNRYRIDKIIGVGGMAVVFDAYDTVALRPVAIKMLRDEISNEMLSVKRFINESKAVAMLDHPNIVKIFDVQVKDGLKYIVMEKIEGTTLKNFMNKKGKLPLQATLHIAEQVLSALQHAHSKGIIHRDIKPQNIMLLSSGKVVVTDFGIAKLPNADTVTIADKAIGTVFYISPEQASGKPIDRRSDIYSFGVMLYEMITGKLPFTAEAPVTVALMHVNNKPKPPSEIEPEIARGLEQIILCAMEKDPNMRFQSAGQMLKYIKELRANENATFKEPIVTPENKGSEKRKNENKDNLVPVIIAIISAFMVVAAISAYFIINSLGLFATGTPSVQIENYVGQEFNELLEKRLKLEGFEYETELVFDESEQGIIIRQSPEAGAFRKRGKFKLYLTISRGSEQAHIPDVTGMTLGEAKNAINALNIKGLKIITESITDEEFADGVVVRSFPAAGEVIYGNGTVTLYVNSIESSDETVIVPNVEGMSEKTATEIITNAGLKCNITEDYSNDIEPGYVISQSISPDTFAEKGDDVYLVISKGKPSG